MTFKMFCLSLTTFGCTLSTGAYAAGCPAVVLTSLPFVTEYAVWRGWRQTLIYKSDLESGCQWAMVRLVKCLGLNGISAAVDIVGKPILQSQLGVVIISPEFHRNATERLKMKIKKLHNSGMNEAHFDWLIATRSKDDFKHVNYILNETAIRFDETIIAAYPIHKQRIDDNNLGLCDNDFKYKIKRNGQIQRSRTLNNRFDICRRGNYNCANREQGTENLRRSKAPERNITYRGGNSYSRRLAAGLLPYNSRYFNMKNISNLFLNISNRHRLNFKANNQGVILIQYFKVRINTTLYGTSLGIWDRRMSMSLVDPPYPVEVRKFLGEQLIFGRCNGTDEATDPLEVERTFSPSLLDDILYYLTVQLNATSSMRYYNKLGYRSFEGAWTGLLGALMDHSIDMALEPVTSHASRNQEMDFVFPIAETMFNIYIRDQETSAVRDIFLAPFNPQLLGCVFAIAIISTAAILLISRFTPIVTLDYTMGFTEAVIWSAGILCQQGGSRIPSSPSASVLLIVCLLFALVTYNSYAAFITSVLSVRVASVDTVADVLQSPHLKIGYIRNGPDQMYLMSTKDAQLNAFYIRGYSAAENLVLSTEEGLLRAAKQDYAFFSEQRTARNSLRSLSQERGRCSLRELAVTSTRAHLAFPLARGSPYSRPVLISLLRLRGNGVLKRLEAVLMPAMPTCAPPPLFASARATDVRSALVLYLTGLALSLFIGAGEYCWKKRCQLQRSVVSHCGSLLNVFD